MRFQVRVARSRRMAFRRDLSRSDQKEALRNAIEHSRQDSAIMNDPAIEQGYLIKRGD
jgi:hypothetical protein